MTRLYWEDMEPHYAIALRPKRNLTFRNFDYRLHARRARAAAAKYIGQSFPYGVSALVLAGGKGSGKTHLLNAAANLAMEYDSNALSFLSASRFETTYDDAMYFDDWPVWKRRFEDEYILAVDDIDQLFKRPELADAMLDILKARSRAKRKSIVTLNLQNDSQAACTLKDYLMSQKLVTLDTYEQ
ncbi:DnaA ATPase domain-containing protein [Neopusillimonas aromaticivorans]|uniref:DnaA ATPase domain-containing protein n=1 Tax=Neopusillimonas aromaticivorans TaxID=2979868 RepID=UPI002595C0EB|nr:DnaA/Hda family protein [Neopusillimonas aromaticivorans]WJJ93972.1 DnaA/Hda family protein [Neopusillimonas aromaticivorans]